MVAIPAFFVHRSQKWKDGIINNKEFSSMAQLLG
jgi:hypothetical protein